MRATDDYSRIPHARHRAALAAALALWGCGPLGGGPQGGGPLDGPLEETETQTAGGEPTPSEGEAGTPTQEETTIDPLPPPPPPGEDACDGLPGADAAGPWRPDADGDGFGGEVGLSCVASPGYTLVRGDCDDSRPDVHAGATDRPGDGLDSDCGGSDGPDSSLGLPSSTWTTLAEALAETKSGGTLWIGPGVWPSGGATAEGLSLRMFSTHGAEATFVDGGAATSVLTLAHANARLEDLTLSGGLAEEGGGIHASDSEVELRRCRIEANTATDGGGLWADGGALHLRASRLTANHADQGGGAFLYSTTLDGAYVDENEAYSGGGLYARRTTITDTWLANNSAVKGGGATLRAGARMSNTGIVDNDASDIGGGLFAYTDAVYDKDNAFRVERLWIAGNSAGTYGGGIYGQVHTATWDHVALLSNSAFQGSAAYVITGDQRLVNATVVGNRGGYTDAIHVNMASLVIDASVLGASGGAAVEVEDGYAAVYHSTVGTYPTGHPYDPATVVFADPLLRNPPKGSDWRSADLHLGIDSPAVDRGIPGAVDLDASPQDQGMYGGQTGGLWDLDGDGLTSWYWPGPWEAPPPGVPRDDWDPDDLDKATP